MDFTSIERKYPVKTVLPMILNAGAIRTMMDGVVVEHLVDEDHTRLVNAIATQCCDVAPNHRFSRISDATLRLLVQMTNGSLTNSS